MSKQPKLTGLLEAVKFYKSEYCLGSLVALECVRIDREVIQIREEVIAGLRKEKINDFPSSRVIEKLRDFVHNILSQFRTDEVKEVRLGNTLEYVFIDKNGEVIRSGPIIVNYILSLPEEDRKDNKLLNTQGNKYAILQAINTSGITSSELEDRVDDAVSTYDQDEPTFRELMLYGRTDIAGSSIYGRALRYQTTKRLEVERKTALFYVLSNADRDEKTAEEKIAKVLMDIGQTKELLKDLKRCTNGIDHFLLSLDIEGRLFGINSNEYENPNPTSDEGRIQVLENQVEYIRTSIIKNRGWLQRCLSN